MEKGYQIGANLFHWDAQAARDFFPVHRCYLYTSMVWNGKALRTATMYHGSDPNNEHGGNFDNYLKRAVERGKFVIPCIHKTPPHINENKEARYHLPHADPNDPKSYADAATLGFQLAARWGSKAWPADVLKVDSSEAWTGAAVTEPLSGLGYVNCLELENEPNRDWAGPDAYYEPEAFAAFCSAVYDGHEGALGKYAGVKQADPAMRVVMGGLAGADITYLKRMAAWFRSNRTDAKFCVDIVGVHMYPNTGYGTNLVAGASPESYKLYDKLADFVEAVKDISDIPVWLTEIGYDTVIGTRQSPVTYKDVEQTAAHWLARAMVWAFAAGVEMVIVYSAADFPDKDGDLLFKRCGIFSNIVDNNEPKFAHKRLLETMKDKDWIHTFFLGLEDGVSVFAIGPFRERAYFVTDDKADFGRVDGRLTTLYTYPSFMPAPPLIPPTRPTAWQKLCKLIKGLFKFKQ